MAVTSTEVDSAIRGYLLTGQSYRLTDGTEVNRGSLEQMMNLRTQLQQEELAAQTGNGMFVRVAQRRPG